MTASRWSAWALLICGVIASAAPSEADESRPSIALIVVDTLRADAVSSYGGPAGVTPAIDALAEAGLRYERAWAPSPWRVWKISLTA